MTGIKLDDNNNFETLRGDFLVGNTDLQDETNVLYSAKGGFLESPTLGVAIETFSNSPMSKPEIERIIRKEFEKDGINLVTVSVKQSTTENDQFDVELLSERNEQ